MGLGVGEILGVARVRRAGRAARTRAGPRCGPCAAAGSARWAPWWCGATTCACAATRAASGPAEKTGMWVLEFEVMSTGIRFIESLLNTVNPIKKYLRIWPACQLYLNLISSYSEKTPGVFKQGVWHTFVGSDQLRRWR